MSREFVEKYWEMSERCKEYENRAAYYKRKWLETSLEAAELFHALDAMRHNLSIEPDPTQEKLKKQASRIETLEGALIFLHMLFVQEFCDTGPYSDTNIDFVGVFELLRFAEEALTDE